MAHENAKIYFDGSHYIAIPKTTRPTKKNKRFTDTDTQEKKKAFETAYKGTKAKRKREKVTEITAELTPHFENERSFCLCSRADGTSTAKSYHTAHAAGAKDPSWQLELFCTFTYDDKKHTEESFKRACGTVSKALSPKGLDLYRGMGRSPERQRLHFHGLFYVPQMQGELVEHRDYSTKNHQMQMTLQNTYFNARFGRCDFSPIDRENLGEATAYLMKYIEKSGERIVYSKNTPTYFVSDILDDDVICTIGQEDKKLLLYDNFSCFDEGVYIGTVSPETIKQMRKKN